MSKRRKEDVDSGRKEDVDTGRKDVANGRLCGSVIATRR
jgi:hypothetical protein